MKALKGSELKAIKVSQKKNLLNDRTVGQADTDSTAFGYFTTKYSMELNYGSKIKRYLSETGTGKRETTETKR